MNSHFCPEIVSIHALDNYSVHVEFSDGAIKLCDLSDHLERGIFKKFRDKDFFKQVHEEHGAAVWSDTIDIAPEYLYEHGKKI